MKSAFIFFAIFFVAFFIIGMITGHHEEPEKNKLIAFAASHVHMNVEDDRAIMVLKGKDNSIVTYRVKEHAIDPARTNVECDKNNELFPMHADELLRESIVGIIAFPTLSEILKRDKAAASKVGENKSGNLIAMVLGAISGYSLGYYCGRPGATDETTINVFNEKKGWNTLIDTVLRRRFDVLALSYFWLIDTHLKKKDALISEHEEYFIRDSFERLMALSKIGTYQDQNWALIYSEKKRQWLKQFLANYLINKKSDYLFWDDYYGVSYVREHNHADSNRVKFLRQFIGSLKSKENELDYISVANEVGQILTHKDIRFFDFTNSDKLRPDIVLGIYKALLRYPNRETLSQMKFYAFEAKSDHLWLPGSTYDRILSNMIDDYPVNSMDD